MKGHDKTRVVCSYTGVEADIGVRDACKCVTDLEKSSSNDSPASHDIAIRGRFCNRKGRMREVFSALKLKNLAKVGITDIKRESKKLLSSGRQLVHIRVCNL
jgi:hypothetical protein